MGTSKCRRCGRPVEDGGLCRACKQQRAEKGGKVAAVGAAIAAAGVAVYKGGKKYGPQIAKFVVRVIARG